jgi:hypothetical protein
MSNNDEDASRELAAAEAAEATDAGDESLEPDPYDLDEDGTVSLVEAERGRLGMVDARLEELAEEPGLKGRLADAAHKVVDKLDND